MSNPPASICLITPGHISSAPRVVKEADALAAAGYAVHVVAGRHYGPVDALDAAIYADARWSFTVVDYRRGAGVTLRKLLHRVARVAVTLPVPPRIYVAAWAQHGETMRLARAAARHRSQLYLGHSVAGLAAAAAAARTTGARHGFDAEDFHEAETYAAETTPAVRLPAQRLQARLLPGCAHLTASSPLIAAELKSRYGVAATTVLNTFPLAEAPRSPVAASAISADAPARLYWFSQTIGPGRGLEYLVPVLARVRTPVRLELRGFAAPDYVTQLRAAVARAGIPHVLHFLPPAPPAEMARLAAHAHLGLSLEESQPRNRDLCLTNKIFAYLLAGVPQLLTPTTAQRSFGRELGEAALPAKLIDPPHAAHTLDAFLSDPARQALSRATAWRLAQERYNWEQEQRAFLASVRAALAR